MTAKDIQKLLKVRHRSDIYVPECKNGSTWFSEHLRLDGLAIARSWANPMITGYEIKVSRADFMRDQKVNQYLRYCNTLYLICPPKLIMPAEVPDTMGLMWVASTGTRIYTKKKAPYREIEDPVDVYKYILISRAKILDYDLGIDRAETKKQFWENWLKEKTVNRTLGRNVGAALREVIAERIQRVETESEQVRRESSHLQDIVRMLEREGIDTTVGGWAIRRQVENKISVLKGALPYSFGRDLQKAIDGLNAIDKALSI